MLLSTVLTHEEIPVSIALNEEDKVIVTPYEDDEGDFDVEGYEYKDEEDE